MYRIAVLASALALGTGGLAWSQGMRAPSADAIPAQYGPNYPSYGDGAPPYGMGAPPYGSDEMRSPYDNGGLYGGPMRRPYGMGAPMSDRHSVQGPTDAASIEAARRLYTVADTVTIGGAALCEGRLKLQTGMRAWSREAMSANAFVNGDESRHDRTVTVFSVAREGPAVRAGLAPGDQILSINGEAIPDAAGAMSVYTAKIDAALARKTTIAIGYRRDGRNGVAQLAPAQGCDIKVVFSNSPMVNALTDGQSVMVMKGLIGTLPRDEELALVVGHEIGHNVLGHFARGRSLRGMGPFANNGSITKLRQFENEADYVGLYFVALSGYDYAKAIESSHRMASVGAMADQSNGTHPSQSERYAALLKTVREIRAKLTQGGQLRPNLRTGRSAWRDTPDEGEIQ